MIKLALVLLLLANIVAAQTKIYRTEDADGKIRFSDRLPIMDQSVEEMDIDLSRQNTSSGSQYSADIAANSKAQKQLKKERNAELKLLEKKLVVAKQSVAMAQQKLTDGKVKVEGDFIAKAGGGARPSPAYRDRIAKLETELADATRNFESIKQQRDKLTGLL